MPLLRALLLLTLVVLLQAEELTSDAVKRIVAAEHVPAIREELRHYQPSEDLTITIDITMGDGKQHHIETTGRQWYVAGDRVVQEMKAGPGTLYFIIGWNPAGHYESWQDDNGAVIHGIGVRVGDHLTWTNEPIVSGRKCRMLELETLTKEGITWRAVLMDGDKQVYANVGAMKF